MVSKNIFVIKRNGQKELLNIDKIHRQAQWAVEGLSGVSSSELQLKTELNFYDGIKTSDIQECLIKAAVDLISEEAINYQYVASRLINYHIRKEVYGGPTPINLFEHVNKVVQIGFYDAEILTYFDEHEWHVLDTFIDHDRDFEMTYAAMEQLRGKYLVKNRVTKEIFETPQMAYILIAATLFHSYPKNTRMKWIKDYYDAISTHWISLPTPVMAGVRTPQRQFSSCTLLSSDDSLESIYATSHAIGRYVSRRAGIGLNVGRIRAVGSPIRKGDAYHTGIVPFIRFFQNSVKSVSQGSIRNSAATLNYPFFHYEFEDLIVLKNSKGLEDNRARHLDYCVQFNKLAYERLLSNGNITLFSPSDVPGLYDAFLQDQDKFKLLYEAAEKNPTIRKKTISALDLFTKFMQERKNTGRIYLMNIDHANTHSSFDEAVAPIEMTNLCCEITLPVKPIIDINSDTEESWISLCTLSAINWGKVREPKDFEKPCILAIRGLDALLDYQEYAAKAAERSTKLFRPLGVGIIGMAHWMAKNNFKYSDDSSLPTLDEYAEAWSYYLIKASNDLAKEFGACAGNHMTKYSKGILPIDTRKQDIDKIVEYKERMPWNKLREDLKTYGIRNATVMALMPSECQSKDNEMLMKDGSIKTLNQILLDANVDIEYYETQGIVGTRIDIKPVELYDSTAYQVYYNGPREMYEVNIEGTIYKFTGNHKLLVHDVYHDEFVRVDKLDNNMAITSVTSINGKPASILSVKKIGIEHTWDVTTNTDTYCLSNGCVSHNTSASVANETNGIEPVRALISIKQSKDGVLKQVVPEYKRLKKKYELLWDQKSPEGYLKVAGVLTKFLDQSASSNISYNPEFFPDKKLPMSLMIQHLLLCYKLGLKTLYYMNTNDSQKEIDVDQMIKDNQQQEEVIEEETSDCDACKI